ncbi:CHASE domain-containing protein [Jiella sp. M17.18]|uniref:CHASE domain-containing protein n=1 Tax=Jiella sp. M17.18 TaxID=3234247 RepID=UPI0034DF2F64
MISTLVFAIAMAISLTLAAQVWMSSEDVDRLRFAQVADDAVARIEARLQLHLSLLDSTHAFLSVEGADISRERFAAFVDGLDLAGHYDGIQGVGFAMTVPTGAEGPAQRALKTRYGIDVSIWPKTDQPIRTPVVLLEPQDARNKAALGFDMFSDPIRRQAMIAAAHDGKARASAPVHLVQEIDENRQSGFLIYRPLFPEGAAKSGDVARTIGFVYAPFRVGDLFSAAFGKKARLPIHVDVFDGAEKPDAQIYSSGEPPDPQWGERLGATRKLRISGRTWLLRMTPTSAFRRTGSGYPAALIAVAGVLLALVLALLTLVQARRIEAVDALNAEGERNLARKDLMLGEMNHRIKNSIARVMAIARQTARGAAGLDDFMERYSARLGAMASAQEVLTHSTLGQAGIADLLTRELRQVFGEGLENCVISGPPVEVGESAAQALGLTFHELATNALKYGALASQAGSLSVTWTLRGDAVAIEWVERGGAVPQTQPERRGFGTRLIDMSIQSELGGTIERHFEAGGLRVVIAFARRAEGKSA